MAKLKNGYMVIWLNVSMVEKQIVNITLNDNHLAIKPFSHLITSRSE